MATTLKGYKINKLLIKIILILTVLAWMIYPTGDSEGLILVKIPALIVTAILIIRNYKFASPKFIAPVSVLILLLVLGLLNILELIDLELIIGLVYFIIFTFLIIISDTIQIDKSIKKWIYLSALTSIGVSTYYAYSPIAHWTGKVYIDYLTLGLYNSNFTGIILFAIGAVFIVSCPKKHFYQRLLNFSIYAWNCYLIFETNCRSALVAAIFVPLASLFLLKYRIKKILIFAILVVPIVFVPLYINLADKSDVTEDVVMGKSVISGRQNVYREYFDNLSTKDLMLGKFGGSGVPNQHNAPLSILSAFGIFGFLAFGYILTKKILQDNDNAKTKDAKFGLYAVLACIIESCGEAVLFSGSFPMFIYVYLLFAFAGSDNHQKKY